MANPVLTKEDFCRCYARHEFGNHTITWDTAEEALASNEPGPFHIRNRVAGGPTYYNIKRWDMPSAWKDALTKQPANLWYVSCMAPDCTIFQGEIARGIWLYDLTYSLVNLPMREALKQQTLYAQGLKARLLMERYLDPGDWDWIQECLEVYKDHVVEFSHFAIPCGTLNRRCVIWEIRKY